LYVVVEDNVHVAVVVLLDLHYTAYCCGSLCVYCRLIDEGIFSQVRRGEPNARNEIRGSFARASRCRGYITRALTRVMTPIHQDASAMTEC
jgi:hypothetical protein